MQQTTKDIEWVAEAGSEWLLRRSATSSFAEVHGPVMTPNGVVNVDQFFVMHAPMHWCICLDFCVSGKHFRRNIERRYDYSRRFLVTLAKRFAEEKFSEFLDDISGY